MVAFWYGHDNAHSTDTALVPLVVRDPLREFPYIRPHALSRFLQESDRFCLVDTNMNTQKKEQRVARGSARWHASRLEGVRKNLGTKKGLKSKGAKKGRHLKKVIRTRASKKRTV